MDLEVHEELSEAVWLELMGLRRALVGLEKRHVLGREIVEAYDAHPALINETGSIRHQCLLLLLTIVRLHRSRSRQRVIPTRTLLPIHRDTLIHRHLLRCHTIVRIAA